MSGSDPGVAVELTWQGGLRFEARAGELAVVLDSQRRAGFSPVQTLAVALAGCMAMDVVDILQKGRYPMDGMQARLTGERRAEATLRAARRQRTLGRTTQLGRPALHAGCQKRRACDRAR